jgi:superfamily II DNA or RNA helicase
MRAVSKLSEGNNLSSEMTRCARSFLYAFTKRRALLAETTAKIDALEELNFILRESERALAFTETVEGAQLAASTLVEHGVNVYPYTSKLDRETRKSLMAQFRAGEIQVLAAPRVLDEGIDLPEADIGVIVAASRSRRQMIQRMGRIIRPKRDNRPAIFIILYVRGTSEDPELGAHEAFLSEMQDNALDCEYFDLYQGTLHLELFIAA